MASTQASDIPVNVLEMVHLRIAGLRRPTTKQAEVPNDAEPTAVLEDTLVVLPRGDPLSSVWEKLRELGYDTPNSFSQNERKWTPGDFKYHFKEFEEIRIVQDLPIDSSKSIQIDDRLIAYTYRRFGKPVELNFVEKDPSDDEPHIDGLKDSRGLEISFHRTVRMPDDDKIHQLPDSLGAFPLYSVAGYSNKLPEKIVQEGGVFLPIWQREALWMSLEAPAHNPYALRCFVGRINTVSGQEMTQAKEEGLQDYVVVPGQDWLDGICIAPGIVRQFVAMPLGSGYTVEGQKTGEEKHGGLPIEIIPSFRRNLRKWLEEPGKPVASDELANCLNYNGLNESKTPRELGLEVGSIIRLYPRVAHERVPCSISDTFSAMPLDEEVVLQSSYESSREGRIVLRGALPRRLGRDSYAGTGIVVQGFGGAPGAHVSSSDEHSIDAALDASLSWSSESSNLLTPTTWEDGMEGPSRSQSEPRQADATPPVPTKNLKAMGLAAGGKLVQDIYRDLYNPAHIWNLEATRLVHVHILDPASCENVTHIVPPPPPIDAMGYVEEGGAFFVVQEQPENRVDGGDFDNVKSVSAMDKAKGVAIEPALDPSQPTQCSCAIRLCDCVVRPCNHQFCNVCVRTIDPSSLARSITSAEPKSQGEWCCPTCKAPVDYVAGFSAPMNLPGEESIKVRVPVNVLEVKDGRVAFKSVQKSRL